MIKAIIFDCFGVLLTDALETLVAELRLTDPAKAENIISLCAALYKGQVDPDLARTEIAADLGMSLDEYHVAMQKGEIKNTALLDYILTLQSNYKIGLLSNVSSGGLAIRFTPEELSKHFDTVVASSDVGYAKPEPAIYQLTADRLEVRYDECVMIDDRKDYCDGAIATGMQTIQYTSLSQLKSDLESLLSYSS